ncbi:MAG: hypothetical protein WBM46_10070 [Polyangiales bacterium]
MIGSVDETRPRTSDPRLALRIADDEGGLFHRFRELGGVLWIGLKAAIRFGCCGGTFMSRRWKNPGSNVEPHPAYSTTFEDTASGGLEGNGPKWKPPAVAGLGMAFFTSS